MRDRNVGMSLWLGTLTVPLRDVEAPISWRGYVLELAKCTFYLNTDALCPRLDLCSGHGSSLQLADCACSPLSTPSEWLAGVFGDGLVGGGVSRAQNRELLVYYVPVPHLSIRCTY